LLHAISKIYASEPAEIPGSTIYQFVETMKIQSRSFRVGVPEELTDGIVATYVHRTDSLLLD
jgi:hypothetical protein